MTKLSKKFQVSEISDSEKSKCDSERRYAAIDIGSNGVRLLLSRVIESGDYCVFTKESLVRMPIRLGEDVFSSGTISPEKEDKLVSTMKAFKHLLDAYDPADYRACATSAMRESENGQDIAERIRRESGLELEIIDGGLEAELIFATHMEETLNPDNAYLYIDVGGGSTELTIFANGVRTGARSFPIGTVRMLQQNLPEAIWLEMKQWVREQRKTQPPLTAIGSGGNMNKLYRLSGKKNGQPMTKKTLKKLHELLSSYSEDERIRILHLRPDRADVIMPATRIFRSVIKWARITDIFVPQFGLPDGLVRVMHDSYVKTPDS